MSKISVIVPVYNVADYLPRCLNSILDQTYTNFELILIDDGSTDGSGTICDEYAQKDNRVTVIHKENGGVSSARNAGLDYAKGKYIAFCDSDDWWDLDFLKTMIDCAEETESDVVVSNYRTMNNFGETYKQINHAVGTEAIDSQSCKLQYMLTGILGNKYGWEVWLRIFRNEIIQRNSIRFCTTCGNYAEDLGFVLEYCLHAKSASSIDYCGYNYLLRAGSMMHSSANIVKLDQMNEVSAHVGKVFFGEMDEEQVRRQYPIVHFLIMRVEYMKIVGTQRYASLPIELSKISQYDWYREQTKAVKNCAKELSALYGPKVARQILLLSHFCLHGNWKRFSIESAIAYRWFIK